MVTTDVYYGGAIVMMFLAEHFGEEIHAGLFAAPMADLMPAFIGIPLNFSASNVRTPLFTSPSSPPFQWRARSCPSQTDNACSNWSHTIDWTAASCASSTGSGHGSTFTDHPLMAGSTPLRAIHFHELRQRIEVLTDRENLPPIQWTDPTLRAGMTPVRRVHLTELRTALDAVYVAAGRARPSYTDAEVTAQATVIKAVHVMELREAVSTLESAQAPSLRHSTERVPGDPTDWHRHPAAADVDAWARAGLNPPEELHDQGDLHQAPVPLQ